MSSNNLGNLASRRQFLAGASGLLFRPSDNDFTACVSRLSDNETGPAADNLISNEDSYPRVTAEIARRVGPGSATIGVGPDQNFSFIAHAQPELAFIIDFRRGNLLLHLLHKALFTLSDDRISYLSLLTARRPEQLPANPSAEGLVASFSRADFDKNLLETAIRHVAELLRPHGLLRDDDWPALARIQAKLAGPGVNARFLALPMYPTLGQFISTKARDKTPAHFLANEPLFQVVRNSQRRDSVIPLVGDFAAGHCLGRVAEFLKVKGKSVGLFYISDVEFFLLRSGKFPAYVANLERLPWLPEAILIRTSTREIDHPERVKGDSATTIVRPVAPFLARSRAGQITKIDQLFE